MRIASVRPNKVAVLRDDESAVAVGEMLAAQGVLPAPGTMKEFIEHYDAIKDQAEKAAQDGVTIKLSPTDLLPPIANPSKIWAAATNYRRGTKGLEDARGRGEASGLTQEETREMIFLKPPSAIVGPEQAVIIPKGADTIFPELELCVVIGKTTRNISKERALDAVFGYTIMLDMTARGYGSGKHSLATRNIRKGFDTFAPIGPWITTADEIPDPMQVTMRLWVNDELVQSAKTDAMVNNVPELISYLSEVGTLYPGDLITTGTPDAPDFQRKLQDGDRLKAEIDGIGSMTLTVRSQA